MNHKILVAVDRSENALKAVQHAAGILPKDARVTLYHVFFEPLPKEVGREDSLLQQHYIPIKERVIEMKEWLEQERVLVKHAMDKAKSMLVEGGIAPDNIALRIEGKKESVARDILREVERGRYDTVIVGRRGLSGAKGFLSGSVSNKIVHHAKSCAVWVVE